eukprot:1160665-Pelagomonas_calceolata.AAC.5
MAKFQSIPLRKISRKEVAAFLARHSNFQLEPIKLANLSDLGVVDASLVVSPEGTIATFPHRQGVMDGSFASRLRRLH